MRLSKLQKFILLKLYYNNNSQRIKTDFYDFYPEEELDENYKNIQDIVHKSLESLTKKDLVITYGRKTAYKWFIEKVRITNKGKAIAKDLISKKQRRLPIK